MVLDDRQALRQTWIVGQFQRDGFCYRCAAEAAHGKVYGWHLAKPPCPGCLRYATQVAEVAGWIDRERSNAQ